jgi:cation diffusion facilitator CzcD-associated flavoprotein CzcO
VRIAIIGAGPGGLCMGKRLLDEGFDDFVLLEKSDGVGGTWNLNRTRAVNDVRSALYSFVRSEADWSNPTAPSPRSRMQASPGTACCRTAVWTTA